MNTKTKLKMLMKIVRLLEESLQLEQRRADDRDLVLLASTLLSFMKEVIEEILVDVELMTRELKEREEK